MKQFLMVFALGLMMTVAQAQRGKPLNVVNVFPIASSGGWDYLSVCPVNNSLYVSHGVQVNVLDKNTGDSIGVIKNTIGVHGIAFDQHNGLGYISNGKSDNVTVFDLKTNKPVSVIATGKDPDAIMYEPFSGKIITCDGHSDRLSIIDPTANKVVKTVDLGGKPETAVSNDAGYLFVNLENKNEVVSVSMKTYEVVHRWALAPGEGPTGLAIDKATNRLFVGCENLLVILNTESGKIVDKLSIGSGCDGVVFDASTRNIYASCGESGLISVIQEKNEDSFHKLADIVTKKGARTIALDAQTHTLYLPTALFEKTAVNGKRPAMIPGSFQILVVK